MWRRRDMIIKVNKFRIPGSRHTQSLAVKTPGRQNDEIDFVIEEKGKVIGLEEKSGAIKKSSGMAAFQKQFKPKKVLLIGNAGLPWQDFLKMNPKNCFKTEIQNPQGLATHEAWW